MLKSLKRKLICGAIAVGITAMAVGTALFFTPHAGAENIISLWKRVGTSLVPINANYDVGSSTQRIHKVWTTALDATSLTLGGAISGNLDVTGVIQAGSTNVNLTDSAGKILFAAINDFLLNDISDVSTDTASPGQYLGWNGALWTNMSVGNTSAGAATVFFNDDTVITPVGTNNVLSIDTLSKIPAGGVQDVDTAVANNNTVILDHVFLYNTALGVTSIPAGVWEFDTYAGVDSAVGVSEILRNVMKVVPEQGGVTLTSTGTGTSRTFTASGGTPFAVSKIDVGGTIDSDSYVQTPQGLYRITARTSDTEVTVTTPSTYANESGVSLSVWKRLFQTTTGEINNISPAYQLYSVNSVQSAFSINSTDKIGSMVFAKTTSVVNRTLSFVHNGTTNYSHFHSTLTTNHNDLPGLQGGTAGEYYHLTAAQNTVVGNTSGTNTGDQDLSGLVTKALYDAFTILYADTDNTPAALNIGTNTVIGRIVGGIVTLAIDSDLSSTSAGDDSVPSAKATKAMGDLKLALTGGTMSGDITLGENTSLALDPAGSADGKYSGITITGTAGTTLAFGDLIYLDPTDSRWELADANIAAGADGDPRGILGICVLAAAGDGSATKILLRGVVRADTAFPTLTINAPAYVSETAGDIVVAQPTTADVVIRVLGFALTADELYFNPSSDYITHI